MTAEDARQEIVQEIIRLRQENGISQHFLGLLILTLLKFFLEGI